jgi:hypothetical protein
MMVRWDQLDTTWGNTLNAMFDNPDADVAAELTQLEADLNDVLGKIAEEEGHEFK